MVELATDRLDIQWCLADSIFRMLSSSRLLSYEVMWLGSNFYTKTLTLWKGTVVRFAVVL